MPVGKKLAAERRSQGKTLPEVEGATKIMGRILTALENESWDDLPASVYVKGYIQNYAQFLRLDPKPLLEEYAQDIGAVAAPRRSELDSIPERTVVPHRLDMHAIPRGAWIGVAVAVVVVMLALWAISALAGRDETPPPIAPETTSTPLPSAVPTEGVGVDVANGQPFVLAIAVTPGDSSWMRILVDGLVAYEGTLPGGSAKEWTVTSQAVVRVGKPAAVTVMRDGQPVVLPPAVDGIAETTLSTSDE